LVNPVKTGTKLCAENPKEVTAATVGEAMTETKPETPSPTPEKVPEFVILTLKRLGWEEGARVVAASDLRYDGQYGECWLAATDSRVVVLTPNGGGEAEVLQDLP